MQRRLDGLRSPRSTYQGVDLERLLALEHATPHDVLGPHIIERDYQWYTAIRAYWPECSALTVALRSRGARWYERLEAELVDSAGFFELIVPGRMDVLYHFEFEEIDGAVSRVDDPYRFEPTLSPEDTARLTDRRGEAEWLLGARTTMMDGVSGMAFAFRHRDATQVSVVGDFNLWDGRRHMMRRLWGTNVWELFVPGLGARERYKFELKTADGEIHLSADPHMPLWGFEVDECSMTPAPVRT